ncbi:hypothetical protein pipiens_018584 [Culex pipiens pipiens]|uniref:Uncharacterized protein n=1 Tax=Culex pipiens pipiens TaxID=38569 RepID=A0ABD1CB29_CULPP
MTSSSSIDSQFTPGGNAGGGGDGGGNHRRSPPLQQQNYYSHHHHQQQQHLQHSYGGALVTGSMATTPPTTPPIGNGKLGQSGMPAPIPATIGNGSIGGGGSAKPVRTISRNRATVGRDGEGKATSTSLPSRVSQIYYKHGLFLSSYPTCATSLSIALIIFVDVIRKVTMPSIVRLARIGFHQIDEFMQLRAPITSTPKASVTRNVRDSIESEKEDFENSSAVTAHERWSFAGWAGHAPRSDVRFQTICFMPMDGSAEAIPNLATPIRTNRDSVPTEGSARDVSRSDEGVLRSLAVRETPTGRRDQMMPSDRRNLATPIRTNRDSVPTEGSARDVSRSDEGVLRSLAVRETPTGRHDQMMPSDRRNLATPIRTNRDSVPTEGSARDVSRSDEGVLRSLAVRETPTGRHDQMMPSDRRNLATPIRTNRDSVPTEGSARDVSRSDEGVLRSLAVRETPTGRHDQMMPSDRRNLATPIRTNRDSVPTEGSARDVSRSDEGVLRSLAVRETRTGRHDQMMPSDRRNLATPIRTNRDSVPTEGSARDVSRSDEGVLRSLAVRETPTGRRDQGMPSDRQDLTSPALSDRPAPPLDDGRSLPDLTLPVTPHRSGCEPMELDVKAPQSDEKLQERNASSSIPNVSKQPMATHFVDVNDVTGRDQSSDESDAGSGEDYSAGSDEDWEPSSGDEDDRLHKMNDTSFLNDYTIRGYFEPFKNFIPDEQETASHKNVNGPRKYTRKLVRSARERGTGYVRQNGTVVSGRTLKAPCSCPKSCGEKFSEEVRAEMLRNLLQMKSESQHQFLACHVAVVKPKRSQVLDSRRKYTRKYFLPGVNGRIELKTTISADGHVISTETLFPLPPAPQEIAQRTPPLPPLPLLPPTSPTPASKPSPKLPKKPMNSSNTPTSQ